MNTFMGIYPSVLVAIVTYNGQMQIYNTLASIENASFRKNSIMVIDNGSQDSTLNVVASFPQCYVKKLKTNHGLGYAYNRALDYAIYHNFKWLFLLDQDSECSIGCLDALIHHVNTLFRNGEKIGGISATAKSTKFPQIIHWPYTWTGKKFIPVTQETEAHDALIQIDSSISSGTLYNVHALYESGGFRNNFL